MSSRRRVPRCGKKSSWYTNQIRNTRLVDAEATRRLGRGYTARLVAAWPCFCRKRYAQTTWVQSAPHQPGRPGPECSTLTWEAWSRVWSASNSTNSKHVPRRRQQPCNGNYVRETWVLNIAHSNNLFDAGRTGGRSVITKKFETFVYTVQPGVLPPTYQGMHIDSKD